MSDLDKINKLKKQLPDGFAIVPATIDKDIEKVGWDAYNATMDMFYIYSDMVKAASKKVES